MAGAANPSIATDWDLLVCCPFGDFTFDTVAARVGVALFVDFFFIHVWREGGERGDARRRALRRNRTDDSTARRAENRKVGRLAFCNDNVATFESFVESESVVGVVDEGDVVGFGHVRIIVI